MKLQTQRWIDRYIGQCICWLFSIGNTLFPRSSDLRPEQISTICIIMLSEIGSMVLAQPMVSYLKNRFPNAAIHVVQLGKNQEIVRLLGFTDADKLHAIDDSSAVQLLLSLWRVIRHLRKIGIDAVIDCELFARISACIAYLSGAKLIAGFTPHRQEGLYRGSFINRAISYNHYHKIADQFVYLARALEQPNAEYPLHKMSRVGTPCPESLPLIAIGADEIEHARQRLVEKFHYDLQKPLVLIYAGGGLLPIRAWPQAHFVQTAQMLIQRGYCVGFIGLPMDKILAKNLIHQVELEQRHAFDLTGYTQTLRELLVLFHLAKLLITNDGGPSHIASLSPIHCIIFFGPETPQLYAPLPSKFGSETVSLFTGIPCSPCLTAYNHRNSPCNGNNMCLKTITPDQVLTHALRLLAQS